MSSSLFALGVAAVLTAGSISCNRSHDADSSHRKTNTRKKNPSTRTHASLTDRDSRHDSHAVLRLVRQGLGPRHRITIPALAASYAFRFEMRLDRKKRSRSVLIEGTLGLEARDGKTPASNRSLTVTKLSKVRPANLSRLLLKEVVGRPLDRLPGWKPTLHPSGDMDHGPILPNVPIGPGAQWTVTKSAHFRAGAPALRMTADCHLEGGGDHFVVTADLTVTCAGPKPKNCHGAGRSRWTVDNGLTTSVESRIVMTTQTSAGAVTQSQIFVAKVLQESSP